MVQVTNALRIERFVLSINFYANLYVHDVHHCLMEYVNITARHTPRAREVGLSNSEGYRYPLHTKMLVGIASKDSIA